MDRLPFEPYDFFGYLSTGLVALFGFKLITNCPLFFIDPAQKNPEPFLIFLILLFSYLIGQILATPAKWLLEDIFVQKVLKFPTPHLMWDQNPDSRKIMRFFFSGYLKPLPKQVQKKVLSKAKSEGLENSSGEDLFLFLRFRDSIRNDQNLMKRIQSFSNMYGFNRNLCFVFFVLAISIPFNGLKGFSTHALGAFFISIVFLYRYLKFFRLYSFELLNSYAGNS